MPSIAELRRDNPWASDYNDAELVSMFADHNQLPLKDAATMFGYPAPKSNAGKSWSSGVDQYQASLWDIPAALGSDYARRQAEQNRAEANLVDSTNDAVKSFEDVHGIGDFGSYIKHGAIQSAPYLAEAIAAGLTGGGTAVAKGIGQAGLRAFGRGAVEREAAELLAKNAGMGGLEAERLAAENVAKGYARTAAAGIGTYPSSVGAVLSRQVEETGQYDPATAFALGVPYAALNMVGLEGQMLRGMPRGLSASALKRAGVGFAEGAIPEGGAEMAQSFLERTGAGLDPFGPGSAREYIDSGILGSVLGGVPGSVSAGVRGPAINREQQVDLLSQGRTRDETFGQAGIDTRSAIYNGNYTQDYRNQFMDNVNRVDTSMYDMGPFQTPIDAHLNQTRFRPDYGTTPDMFGGSPAFASQPAAAEPSTVAPDEQTLQMFNNMGTPTLAADNRVSYGRQAPVEAPAAPSNSDAERRKRWEEEQAWLAHQDENVAREIATANANPAAPPAMESALGNARRVASPRPVVNKSLLIQAGLRGQQLSAALKRMAGKNIDQFDEQHAGDKQAYTAKVADALRAADERWAEHMRAVTGQNWVESRKDFAHLSNPVPMPEIGANPKTAEDAAADALAAQLQGNATRVVLKDGKMESAPILAVKREQNKQGNKERTPQVVMSLGDILATGVPLNRLSIVPATHEGGNIRTTYDTRMDRANPDAFIINGVVTRDGLVGAKPNFKANVSYLGRLLAVHKNPQVVQMARDALKGMAFTAIAEKYGVSDGTVSNRIRKLGLSVKEGDFNVFKREHDLGDAVSYASLFGENANAESAGVTISDSPSDTHVKEDKKTSKDSTLADEWEAGAVQVDRYAGLEQRFEKLQQEKAALEKKLTEAKKQRGKGSRTNANAIRNQIADIERRMNNIVRATEVIDAEAEAAKAAVEEKSKRAEELAASEKKRKDVYAAVSDSVEQDLAEERARLEEERKLGETEITNEDRLMARDEYNDVLEMVTRDGGENLPTWKELSALERRRVVMALQQFFADKRAGGLKAAQDKMRAAIKEVVNGREVAGSSQVVAEGATENAANEVSPAGHSNETEGSRDAGNDAAGKNAGKNEGAWKGLENLRALISKARLDELRKLGLPTQLLNQIAGIARTQKEPLKFFDATINTYRDFDLEVQDAKRSAPENAANVVDRGWKDVHEAIDGSKTLGEALTKLLNFPHTAKWQKVLINALLKSNGVRQSALVLNPNFVLSKTIANGVALGNYVPDTNVTILHAGGGLQSLLHEAIHAAIYNKMDNDQAFAFQIQKLYTKAKKALGEGHYGLTDIQEFVAEAFTNPEFQKALAGIPSTNTGSVWQAFVDAVRAALKLFGIQRNLLDDVISVASIHIADESVAPAQQGTQRVAPERAVLGVEIPAPAARYGTQLGRYLKSKVSNLGMSVMFGHDLQAYAEKYLPGEVSKYFKAVWDKFNERSRLELMVQKVGEAFHRLDMPQRKRVIDFMRTSRLEGKWGFNPEFLPADKDGKRPEVDTEMAKLYEALGSDEAKAVVQSVFAVGHKMLKEHEMALLERIEGVEEDIKRLTKEPESEQERTELTKELNALKTAKNTKLKEMQTPYVPLFREGSHIVTMKSQELLAAEKAYKEALNGDGVAAETTKDLREEYMKLRKDASHYRMYMRDDWEATGLQLDLEKEFPKAQVTMRAAEKEYQQLTELPRQMMERVASMLEADDKGSRSVRKEINQMYLNYLNQDHPLKHQMKAEGIAGFDEDMMRGFLKSGRKQAAMIASIRTQRTMMDALYSIRRAARDDTTGNAKIKMDIANKITQRYLAASEFRETPVQDWLMRNNSLFMLLFSPAYYFQNATQPFTTSAPIMAGRFGSAAYTKLWAAYRDDVPALLKSKFSLDTLKGDEQRMAKELEMRSHLDFGSDIELGELAERKSLSDNKVSEYWRDGNNFLRNSVQRVEKINRLTTALAAYRLMKEELTKKGGLSAEEIHQQATNYADQVIVDTHGDYSGANAPLFMTQGNKTLPVKVMTQFKKFQLIQLSLLFKTAKDALVNADPKQKAIARRSLLHMGTVYGTLAGAAGLPAFSLMAPLLAATLSGLSDDDDDKQGKHEDSVAYLRRMARKAGASEFATTALFKGLPAAVGWDMSNMVGMGKVLDPLPYTDSGKTTKDTLTNYLWGLAGPVGTRAQKIATAFDLAQEGQYWKAAEQVVPSGFSNAMQGYRIGTEGVTDRKGDVLYSPDEVGTVNAVMKAAGFAPSMVTDRSWRASIKSQTEEAFNRDSTAVRREAEAAFRENDPAKIDEARQAFVELQRERQQMGFKPQTLKDFYNIRKDMAKRERNVAGGIEFTKGNEKFVKRLADT